MRTPLAVLAAIALFASAAVGPGVVGAAHDEADRTVFALELEADGDATVVYVNSYNLSTPAENETYRAFLRNETRRRQFRETAVTLFERGAAIGRNETGWEMRITNVTMRTYRERGWGRIEVRAHWSPMAYADERRVIVAQPFRGGFDPHRDVAIHGPPGYVRNVTVPSPLRARTNSVLLNPVTSNFSKFYMEFVDPDAPTPTAAGDGTGGVTDPERGDRDLGTFLRAAVVAVVPAVIVLLAIRRR